MAFEASLLIPAAGTLAAALVAGGIARANLIASKETKVSEFRQAWIDALREDLAALFSNVRTVCRALEEFRSPHSGYAKLFNFPQSKIVEARHAAGETFHRIRLRLNEGQDDHKELRRLLTEMMHATQDYIDNTDTKVSLPLNAVEGAAKFAENILKSEWETVKRGESAYQLAVSRTGLVLNCSLILLVILLVAVPLITWYFSRNDQPLANPKPANVPLNLPAAPSNPKSVVRPPSASVDIKKKVEAAAH